MCVCLLISRQFGRIGGGNDSYIVFGPLVLLEPPAIVPPTVDCGGAGNGFVQVHLQRIYAMIYVWQNCMLLFAQTTVTMR